MTTTTEAADTAAVTAGSPPVVEGRRWALRPLLDACGLSSPAGLAAELGLSRDHVTAAGRRGLSDSLADEWAIRVGLHPVLVWGWAWVDVATHTTPTIVCIADALRGMIERGTLAPGEPLPTVKALTEQWGVGDKTITCAVAELTRAGLVVAPGRGQRPVVVGSAPLVCQSCGRCGEPIDPGTEHYPHEPACTQAGGWCDCDQVTHPGCCSTCGGWQ